LIRLVITNSPLYWRLIVSVNKGLQEDRAFWTGCHPQGLKLSGNILPCADQHLNVSLLFFTYNYN